MKRLLPFLFFIAAPIALRADLLNDNMFDSFFEELKISFSFIAIDLVLLFFYLVNRTKLLSQLTYGAAGVAIITAILMLCISTNRSFFLFHAVLCLFTGLASLALLIKLKPNLPSVNVENKSEDAQ